MALLILSLVPITLATNPIKVYEYLSAGKPVVATELPELKHFDNLIYLAQDIHGFIEKINIILTKEESVNLAHVRQSFVRDQTWERRARALLTYAEDPELDPTVSIILVTYQNYELTFNCLYSIEKYAQYDRLELIVIDNASTDGTRAYLQEWVKLGENRKLILNKSNIGFSSANNQGLEIACGEYLLLLNNDTFITLGAIRTLAKHLVRDNSIGIIGPITNNIGNEAKIDIKYNCIDEMLDLASHHTRRHLGITFPMKTIAFFCAMFPRDTYEKVGRLDERYGLGWFEDDDYCRRIEQIGKKSFALKMLLCITNILLLSIC